MMKIASLINHLRLFDYNLEHPKESLTAPDWVFYFVPKIFFADSLGQFWDNLI